MKPLSNALNKTGEMQHVRQHHRDSGVASIETNPDKPKIAHRTFWRQIHKYAKMQNSLTPSAVQVLCAMERKADLHNTPHLAKISYPEILNSGTLVRASVKNATALLLRLKIATPITPKGRSGDKPTEYLITRPWPADDTDERGGFHRYCENVWDGVATYYENDETHQWVKWARFLSFENGGALEIEHEGETPSRNFLINLSLHKITVGEREVLPPPITRPLVSSIESRLMRLEQLASDYSGRKFQIKINL